MDEFRFSLWPIEELHTLGILWRRLEKGSETSFFVSWSWIGTWLKCLPKNICPMLLRVTRGEETVAAAIVVKRQENRRGLLKVRQAVLNGTGEPEFDCITIEHNGFVGASGQSLWPALLRWFAHGGADTDELLLPGVSEGAMVAVPPGVKLLHKGRMVPGLACALTGLSPQNQLSRNSRQQLNRSFRACAALGNLQIEQALSVDVAQQFFSQLKALHIPSWSRRQQPNAFRYPYFETFHRALIDSGVSSGAVRLLRVSAGATILGYLYDFQHAGRVYAYQSGFDDAYRRLRPGYVSHSLAMKYSHKNGATTYDFLGGDNRLKRTFANREYTLGWHSFGRHTLPLWLEAMGEKSVRSILRR